MSVADQDPLRDVAEFLRHVDPTTPLNLPRWMTSWLGRLDTSLDEDAIRFHVGEHRELRPHSPTGFIVVHPEHPNRAEINQIADLADAHVLENPYLGEPDQVLVVDLDLSPTAADLHGSWRGQRAHLVILDEVPAYGPGGQLEGEAPHGDD